MHDARVYGLHRDSNAGARTFLSPRVCSELYAHLTSRFNKSTDGSRFSRDFRPALGTTTERALGLVSSGLVGSCKQISLMSSWNSSHVL